MSRTLVSEHLTPTELSGLSAQDRTLLRAVAIISSESGKKSAVRQNDRGKHQKISPALVGFECVYCSLAPEVLTLTEKSKRLNKVFPGSIESLGASLELLREKHFSADAAEMKQRCQLLPFAAREIFDNGAARESISDKVAAATRESSSSHSPNANLDSCCRLVAGRLGLTSKKPGSMTGIIFQSVTAGPPEPGLPSHSMMETSECNTSTEGKTWASAYYGNVSFRRASSADKSPLHTSKYSGSDKSEESPSDENATLPYLPIASIAPYVPSPSLSFVPLGSGFCCPHCDHIPFHLREGWSYQEQKPTGEKALRHFRKCQFFAAPR